MPIGEGLEWHTVDAPYLWRVRQPFGSPGLATEERRKRPFIWVEGPAVGCRAIACWAVPPAARARTLTTRRPRKRRKRKNAKTQKTQKHKNALQGSAEAALAPGSPLMELAAPWRVLLLSDGSVTRHLELLTGRETTVDCLQMLPLPLDAPDEAPPSSASPLAQQHHQQPPPPPPPAARRVAPPLLQRQALLRAGGEGAPLVYAASWWCSATVSDYLKDGARPIWVSLSMGQVEVFREILEVRGRAGD